MTDAQTKALADIVQIMREHFQAAVIVVEGEGKTDRSEDLSYGTSGTRSSALGLLEYGKDQLLNHNDPAAAPSD